MPEHDRMLDWLRGDRSALSKFPDQPKHLPATLFKDLAPYWKAQDQQYASELVQQFLSSTFRHKQRADGADGQASVETIDGRYIAGLLPSVGAQPSTTAEEGFYLRSPRVILVYGVARSLGEHSSTSAQLKGQQPTWPTSEPVDVERARWNYITHLDSPRFVSAPWLHSFITGKPCAEERKGTSASIWLLRKTEEDGQLSDENGHEVGVLVVFLDGEGSRSEVAAEPISALAEISVVA